jgi:biotin operon repressor
MAKRYTHQDDCYIVEFDGVPLRNIAMDLGRSEASIKSRIKHLKNTGAWVAITKAAGYRAIAHLRAGYPLSELFSEEIYEAITRAGLQAEHTP